MDRKSHSIVVRNFYSPGLSSLMVKYFKENLSFGFAPSLGKKGEMGLENYCFKTMLFTSVDHQGAGCLYIVIKRILEGMAADKQVEAILLCRNNAKLVFEWKPCEDDRMRAYLSIHKNNKVITFLFGINEIKVTENGETVKKVVQSALIAFLKVIEGYLITNGADEHIRKQSEEMPKPLQEPSPESQ